MAITKNKKQEILSKLADVLKKAKSVVFVNFHGVSVDDINKIRGEFKDEGIGYYVAKKTLVKKALDEAKPKGDTPSLDGELALAWSEDDETTPARKIHEFGKSLKEGFSILGGIFEGKFRNKEEMTEIATIPDPNTLRGMFVNVINSPIQGLVIALEQIKEKKN